LPVSVGVVWPEALAADESLPDIAGLARVAEQAGLDGAWTGDRLIKDEMNVPDGGRGLGAAAVATDGPPRPPRWPPTTSRGPLRRRLAPGGPYGRGVRGQRPPPARTGRPGRPVPAAAGA